MRSSRETFYFRNTSPVIMSQNLTRDRTFTHLDSRKLFQLKTSKKQSLNRSDTFTQVQTGNRTQHQDSCKRKCESSFGRKTNYEYRLEKNHYFEPKKEAQVNEEMPLQEKKIPSMENMSPIMHRYLNLIISKEENSRPFHHRKKKSHFLKAQSNELKKEEKFDQTNKIVSLLPQAVVNYPRIRPQHNSFLRKMKICEFSKDKEKGKRIQEHKQIDE